MRDRGSQVGLLFEPAGMYDELLRGVAAPALVVGGEGDKLTPLRPMGERVAALLPRARLASLPRAGHQVRRAGRGLRYPALWLCGYWKLVGGPSALAACRHAPQFSEVWGASRMWGGCIRLHMRGILLPDMQPAR